MTRYTDLAHRRDDEGIYDLVLDPDTGDFETIDGLEASIFVSLFSDRRAQPDEVPDPLKRRGWIGDLTSGITGDVHGSGLWLFEQHRLTEVVAAGVRLEAEAALDWMVEENLARSAAAQVLTDPDSRQLTLLISLDEPGDGVADRAFRLADATRTGAFVRLGV